MHARLRNAPGAVEKAAVPSAPGKLINIDNGGTLTDICVIDGDLVYHTKTITTPQDLSRCLFEGLRKVSETIYGREDLLSLLLSSQCIRYSTTQGTNALVERKGPRLGLILGGTLTAEALREPDQSHLLESLVGTRIAELDSSLNDQVLETAVTRMVARLCFEGANRVVIAFGGSDYSLGEAELKRILLRKFPQHLLGAVPILYTHEIAGDTNDVRRTWTALLNAFLHPAVERFLYTAEHRLREYRIRNPLLIFRNDGYSARVAKTAAIKTYGSGPRGGAEGARALARHYGFAELLSMDIGGTTTDMLLVDDGEIQTQRHGLIENIPTSLPLSAVLSIGAGGSSIVTVIEGQIVVGPESVGSAPGPACFGLGGTQATITDAMLSIGLLDPDTYFGGQLRIDVVRARNAIGENVAKPLGCSLEVATERMIAAWVGKIASALKEFTAISSQTTLAAFGGAGPLLACRIADAAGIGQVVIPGLAPVFSAFGIGFSDIAHEYEMTLDRPSPESFAVAKSELMERARRGMFSEGADLDKCRWHFVLRFSGEDALELGADPDWPEQVRNDKHAVLSLLAVKPIMHAKLHGRFGENPPHAQAFGERRVAGQNLPLFRVESQPGGAQAHGPAVIEDAFFTSLLDDGWKYEINEKQDILLQRIAEEN